MSGNVAAHQINDTYMNYEDRFSCFLDDFPDSDIYVKLETIQKVVKEAINGIQPEDIKFNYNRTYDLIFPQNGIDGHKELSPEEMQLEIGKLKGFIIKLQDEFEGILNDMSPEDSSYNDSVKVYSRLAACWENLVEVQDVVEMELIAKTYCSEIEKNRLRVDEDFRDSKNEALEALERLKKTPPSFDSEFSFPWLPMLAMLIVGLALIIIPAIVSVVF